MKKNKATTFLVNAKDLLNPIKNPGLSLSSRDIIKNKKIKKTFL